MPNPTRRDFLAALPAVAGASALWPHAAHATPALTVQEVIDLILAEIPGGPVPQTVDTIKAGTGAQTVNGVATTFLATSDVVQRAVAAGANFIITHEPTYYNHLDATDHLQDDPVYTAKRQLLADEGVVIWRFHDYIHRHKPDGILAGFLEDMGWDTYEPAPPGYIVPIAPQPLDDLARHLKTRLGIEQVRVVGDAAMPCSRVGLLLGAMGGPNHLRFLGQYDVDVLIVGETAEWETTEYVRDGNTAGRRRGLIVLGHAPSEEPGMRWLAEWLRPRLPNLPVVHIPTTNPFHFV